MLCFRCEAWWFLGWGFTSSLRGFYGVWCVSAPWSVRGGECWVVFLFVGFSVSLWVSACSWVVWLLLMIEWLRAQLLLSYSILPFGCEDMVPNSDLRE